MSESRVRTLLMASVTIMLCMAMLICGTYALFSDKVELPTHLQAGTLKVKLIRTELKQRKVDADGMVKTVKNETFNVEKDFTNATSDNVFGLEENELVAPTSMYSATMRVVNNGGNIAFDYGVYINLDTDEEQTDEELAKQISITVVRDGTKETKLLSDCENYRVTSGRVLATDDPNAQSTFTVTVEFVNNTATADNDYAQGKKVKFDLFVIAVQATEQTTDKA